MFMMCARARVCVIHWHCSAQLSMFNMEKRYRNKIITILIIIIYLYVARVIQRHFRGSTHVPLRALQMQMRELYDQSEYLL